MLPAEAGIRSGEGAKELHAGDVVDIPAGVKHWHGQLGLLVPAYSNWGSCRGSFTEWLEPVTDEVYNKLP